MDDSKRWNQMMDREGFVDGFFACMEIMKVGLLAWIVFEMAF